MFFLVNLLLSALAVYSNISLFLVLIPNTYEQGDVHSHPIHIYDSNKWASQGASIHHRFYFLSIVRLRYLCLKNVDGVNSGEMQSRLRLPLPKAVFVPPPNVNDSTPTLARLCVVLSNFQKNRFTSSLDTLSRSCAVPRTSRFSHFGLRDHFSCYALRELRRALHQPFR